MPVHWTLDPGRELVTIVAEGEVIHDQLIAMVAVPDRPLRIFVAPEPAMRWLLAQPSASPAGRTGTELA